MKARMWLALVCIGLVGVVMAEESQAPHVCGAGPGADEVLAGTQPGGNGMAPTPLCYWKSQAQPEPSPPTGYWQKTWGALAPSPQGGVLGVALGASTKQEAERLALADCKRQGGPACEVSIAYHHQCVAMVVGDKTYVTFRAQTDAKARDFAMLSCRKKNSECGVYYSACTEPIFHKF